MSRKSRTRTNESIRAKELRVIDQDGENIGILSRDEALEKAREAELDLIEIAPTAKPPVAKIMDYGKYKYDEQKKRSKQKAKGSTTETKVVQVKIGTGKHDLELKAGRVEEWLEEGHRVKVELYLVGRAKYLDRDFLESRLERFLKLIPAEYKVAENIRKVPKGLAMVIEKA